MKTELTPEVLAVQAITSVPTILEAVAAITGLRFVCVAHVTADSWTTCAVLDKLNFGLQPGDNLDVTTTLCEEVRNTHKAVVIDHVSRDEKYREHHTPRIYGFESYISVPIVRTNGEYFGTLCGLDPLPASLSTTATISSMTLFAQLISLQLASEEQLDIVNSALRNERATAELREQFIAVLGHDLRNPLNAISMGAQLLATMPSVGEKAAPIIALINKSADRIGGIVDDVVDFTRGRMGGGIQTNLLLETQITALLHQVVLELSSAYPSRTIDINIADDLSLICDKGRLAQLLSNLLKNALVHGDPTQPVKVFAAEEDGIFQLAVSNGGAAIPQGTVQQLFKPYWRPTQSSTTEGLGLGLFIVSEIALSHAGQIRVISSDDITSFIFTMKSANFVERRSVVKPLLDAQERRQSACTS